MKKKTYLALLLTLLLVCVPCAAAAEENQTGETVNLEYQDGMVLLEKESGRVMELYNYSGRLVLPSSLEGYQLKILGSGAVPENSEITELVLPHGMVAVEENAGYQARNFRVMELSDTVREVDPNSVYWTEFERFIVPEGNPYLSQGSQDEVYADGGAKLVVCPPRVREIDLGPEVREIGRWAFSHGSLERITLPEGLERIGECAFLGCVNLKSVRLGKALTEVGDRAFTLNSCRIEVDPENKLFFTGQQGELYGQGGERLLYCPKETKTLSVRPGTRVVASGAVAETELENLELPEGLTEIGDEAFAGSIYGSDLKAVEFPSTLRRIERNAFFCNPIERVVLPEGLEYLGNNAFSASSQTKVIVFPSTLKEIDGWPVIRELALCYVREGTLAHRRAVEERARFRLGSPEEYPEDYPLPAQGTPFADMEKRWSEQAVRELYRRQLLNGVSRDRFGPTGTMTRAMLVTILYREAGSPEVGGGMPFTDVPANAYYADAVRWAKANDVMEGIGGGRFSPNTVLNREQAVTILFRLAGKTAKIVVTDFMREAMKQYRGHETVSPWAKDAMAWGIDREILKGDGSGLNPKGSTTREQAAAFLCRYLEWRDGGGESASAF